MAKISMRKRILFIHIPKTGGQSINKALGVPNHSHLPLHNPHTFSLYQESTLCFSVVRNPLKRAESLYNWYRDFQYYPKRKRRPENIALALMARKFDINQFWDAIDIPYISRATHIFRPQEWFLREISNVPGVCGEVKILRYESLTDDWQRLRKLSGNKLPESIPWQNASGIKGDKQVLSGESRQRVIDLYRDDFKRFNYPIPRP